MHQQRQWRRDNKDKIAAINRSQWYKGIARNWSIKKKFGINLTEYNRMLAAQGSVCAICFTKPNLRHANLAIDHDHATGKIRALLCARCNTAIGHLMDSPTVVESAVAYLRKHSGQNVPYTFIA
jgi:hypothetical protein